MVSPEHANLSIFIAPSGFSLDGSMPIQFLPGLIIEETTKEQIIKPGFRLKKAVNGLRKNSIEFVTEANANTVVPRSSTDISTVSDEEAGVFHHKLTLMPRIQEPRTNEYLTAILGGISPEHRQEAASNIMSFASLQINSDGFITLAQQNAPMLQVRDNGTWIVSEGLTESNSPTWEGLHYYKAEVGDSGSFFECVIGEIDAEEPVEDYLGTDQVTMQVMSKYFLVVGVLFESRNENVINEKIRALIKQRNLSDKTIRNVIDPYLAIVKASPN